jgi:hypothetical protein
MARPKEPTESHGNGAASGAGSSPMDRFRRLTKDLSRVDPEDVREAERRERDERKRTS